MRFDGACIFPFHDQHPVFQALPAFLGTHAAILGRTSIGRGAWVAPYAVIRADGNDVRIGNDFHLGAGATVHISDDCGPTVLGDGVTVEANAVVHACEIGDRCLIGANAIVLDGAVVGDAVLLDAGSLVYPRSRLRRGWLYAGQPARPIRRIGDSDLILAHAHSRQQERASGVCSSRSANATQGCRSSDVFIAANACIHGRLAAPSSSSVWYSCYIDAAQFEVSLGARSNVQDNVRIVCRSRDVHIGAHVTIGHNASLTDCEIGCRALIGIGATLAPHTIVADDVLLAAGAETEPGQHLETGWLWAGRPARPLRRLDGKARKLIARVSSIYCTFAREFHSAQRDRAVDLPHRDDSAIVAAAADVATPCDRP